MANSLRDAASLFLKLGDTFTEGVPEHRETVRQHARVALEKAAIIIEEEAKRVIGTYDYGWPQLAEATQRQRERAGYPANEPLLRTGELRDSIEHFVPPTGDLVAYVGSNNPKAVWQELGTATIPPRSFLLSAAMKKEREIYEQLGIEIHAEIVAQMQKNPDE